MKNISYLQNCKEIFNDLLISYNINIKNEFQFVYDDFLEHLISDSERLFNRNYNPTKKGNYFSSNQDNMKAILINANQYKIAIFKGELYKHLSASYWLNKLQCPEKYSEFKRKLRQKKLNKILK